MPSTSRMDNSKEKRVELHMHTQMSQMDGVSSASDLIKRAMKWGMKSIAITDHGVVQSFPDAHHLLEGIGYDKTDFKVIYGFGACLNIVVYYRCSYTVGSRIECNVICDHSFTVCT